MKSFQVAITIRATPERVWQILTDGASWPAWNPTVEKVDRPIIGGSKLKVFTKLTPGRAFPVRVSEFSPPHRMVWTGGMPLGLFKGERIYTLTPTGAGTEFSMRETFTGLMAPLICKSIPDLQPSFNEFAAALQRHVEQTA
ncbi:MAG: hypothetical protein JWM57_3794 [Phycisphaerales bacterium]|nr:hypothetical protein [Phycisphaerales bacterium]